MVNNEPDDVASRPASERHVPVLLDRCVGLLEPGIRAGIEARGRAVVVDCTLGMGGHSEAMLERFPELHLIGLDRDEQALALAGARLERFAGRTDLVHAVYDEVADVVADLGFAGVDASCSISGCPPCSWTSATAASPTPTTPRWTCGWTPEDPPPPTS